MFVLNTHPIKWLSKAGAASVNTISSIELDWRRENVGISERLLAEKISISSLARPQGTYVFPANGHGRPAKRRARGLFGSASLARALWLSRFRVKGP